MKKIVILLLSLVSLPFAVQAQNIAHKDHTRVVTKIDISPMSIKHESQFCGIFHIWGFIGDSLTSGEHEYKKSDGSTGYIDLYDYSWGQCICRATGTKGYNFSQSGETAHGWIKNFWNNPKNNNNNIDAKSHPAQAYIMALGVNDENMKFPIGDVDKDVNLTDYNKNADTFAGDYAGIIQRVRSIQPRSKFFVVTIPNEEATNNTYNDVIRKIAKKFDNVYVIDLYKYGPSYRHDTDLRKNFFAGGHMNAAGYQFTAWLFINFIDDIISHNFAAFSDAAFIGTDYHY